MSIHQGVMIGKNAFRGCQGLADNDGFVIINSILFDYFGRQKRIVIPDRVRTIDQVYTESKCVLDVEVPESVEAIRKGAFSRYSPLIKVALPKALMEAQDEYDDILFVESIGEKDNHGSNIVVLPEGNPFRSIWRCYDPYVKGKKENIDRLLADLNLASDKLKIYQIKD